LNTLFVTSRFTKWQFWPIIQYHMYTYKGLVQPCCAAMLWFKYCEIIFLIRHLISCTLWVGQSMNFRCQPNIYLIKYFCVLFENPWTQVSTNMSIIVKPRNCVPTKLNDFTVISLFQHWMVVDFSIKVIRPWASKFLSRGVPVIHPCKRYRTSDVSDKIIIKIIIRFGIISKISSSHVR